MKTNTWARATLPVRTPIVALAALLLLTPGCAVIGDIFKAGVWVGVVAIMLVIGLGVGLVSLFRSRS